MICELKPVLSKQNSYYGKAIVEIDDNNILTLYSYNTIVLEIDLNLGHYQISENVDSKLVFSKTTTKHIIDCLYQYVSKDYRFANKKWLKEHKTNFK